MTCAAGGALYRPVQLEVLSGEVEEVQEAVNNLVLANSLISHQQQMFAQCIVLHHILQQTKMLHMCMQYVQYVRIFKVKDVLILLGKGCNHF